jgi:DNA-binding HxlR family transcriptional regulator
MTTGMETENKDHCPAEGLLKMLSGKWKPQIFRLALEGPVRFNALLRQLVGSNKQSVAVALKELEEQGLLGRTVVREKPLHIEYTLSEKGRMLIPVFRQLESLVNETNSGE